jgi:hypothetical protein
MEKNVKKPFQKMIDEVVSELGMNVVPSGSFGYYLQFQNQQVFFEKTVLDAFFEEGQYKVSDKVKVSEDLLRNNIPVIQHFLLSKDFSEAKKEAIAFFEKMGRVRIVIKDVKGNRYHHLQIERISMC